MMCGGVTVPFRKADPFSTRNRVPGGRQVEHVRFGPPLPDAPSRSGSNSNRRLRVTHHQKGAAKQRIGNLINDYINRIKMVPRSDGDMAPEYSGNKKKAALRVDPLRNPE